jgi:hypothetical protein
MVCVTCAQGNNGQRRGVLVLDTWEKNSVKSKARKARSSSAAAAGSWRSTPYASQPANGSSSSVDVNDASSAAARSYYSMMSGNGSSIASPTDGIYDPVQSHQPDPSVMQLWTDKPRFNSSQPSYAADNQQHHDPWRQQQQQQQHVQKPRVFVPPPPSGATSEEYARWQALHSVMAALQHSSGAHCWSLVPRFYYNAYYVVCQHTCCLPSCTW